MVEEGGGARPSCAPAGGASGGCVVAEGGGARPSWAPAGDALGGCAVDAAGEGRLPPVCSDSEVGEHWHVNPLCEGIGIRIRRDH